MPLYVSRAFDVINDISLAQYFMPHLGGSPWESTEGPEATSATSTSNASRTDVPSSRFHRTGRPLRRTSHLWILRQLELFLALGARSCAPRYPRATADDADESCYSVGCAFGSWCDGTTDQVVVHFLASGDCNKRLRQR